MIYFDSAATSFHRPPTVMRAVADSIRLHAGYGRSGHAAAERAAEAVYDCRMSAAELFGLSAPERVVFCQNATQALNTAIFGLSLAKKRVVISGYEHNAVYRPLIERGDRDGTQVVIAQSDLFDTQGAFNAFDRLLDESCGLCICTMVSNVFGNILPVEGIGRLCRERGIPFIIDASQAAGSLTVDARRLSADIICVPGHKGLLGPVGTGLMLLCTDIMPTPFLFGGTGGESESPRQPMSPPERYESGTQNIAGICGLREGIRYVLRQRTAIRRQEAKLIAYLKNELTKISGVTVYGGTVEACGGLFSFNAAGWDCETVAARLAEHGIAVRAGLHCAPLAHRSVGTERCGTVRISCCGENTLREAERFCNVLEEITRRK